MVFMWFLPRHNVTWEPSGHNFAVVPCVEISGGGSEVSKYAEPEGEGVRVDAALYAGGSPSMHYAEPAQHFSVVHCTCVAKGGMKSVKGHGSEVIERAETLFGGRATRLARIPWLES